MNVNLCPYCTAYKGKPVSDHEGDCPIPALFLSKQTAPAKAPNQPQEPISTQGGTEPFPPPGDAS